MRWVAIPGTTLKTLSRSKSKLLASVFFFRFVYVHTCELLILWLVVPSHSLAYYVQSNLPCKPTIQLHPTSNYMYMCHWKVERLLKTGWTVLYEVNKQSCTCVLPECPWLKVVIRTFYSNSGTHTTRENNLKMTGQVGFIWLPKTWDDVPWYLKTWTCNSKWAVIFTRKSGMILHIFHQKRNANRFLYICFKFRYIW